MGYITPTGARKLPVYTGGNTIDKSLLYKYIVSPSCNVIVEWFPKAFQWVHFAAAFCIFFYMMMDNIDGKQARRTKTSSPLGELFDHGCDSFTVGLATLVVGLSVGMSLWQILLTFVLSMVPFYLAHWEEYFTHHLVLGMFNGPTEAEFAVITACCISGVYGQSFWFQPVTLYGGYTLQLKEFMFLLMTITSIATSLLSIFSGTRKAISMKISLLTAYSQLLPFTLFCVLECLWIYVSPELYFEYPIVHILSLTFIFSYLSSGYNTTVSEELALFGLFGVSLGFIMHFTYTIIQEMCAILKITAFTVPKEKQQ
eukprot:gene14486-17090_t